MDTDPGLRHSPAEVRDPAYGITEYNDFATELDVLNRVGGWSRDEDRDAIIGERIVSLRRANPGHADRYDKWRVADTPSIAPLGRNAIERYLLSQRSTDEV